MCCQITDTVQISASELILLNSESIVSAHFRAAHKTPPIRAPKSSFSPCRSQCEKLCTNKKISLSRFLLRSPDAIFSVDGPCNHYSNQDTHTHTYIFTHISLYIKISKNRHFPKSKIPEEIVTTSLYIHYVNILSDFQVY